MTINFVYKYERYIDGDEIIDNMIIFRADNIACDTMILAITALHIMKENDMSSNSKQNYKAR